MEIVFAAAIVSIGFMLWLVSQSGDSRFAKKEKERLAKLLREQKQLQREIKELDSAVRNLEGRMQ